MPIQKRPTKKGETRYRAHLMVNGERASKSFDNVKDAKIWLIETEDALKAGKDPTTKEEKNDMNFFQAIDRFIVENRTTISRGHLKNYEFARLQLERSLGPKIRMSEITPQDVSAHIVKRLTVDRVGPTSIRAEMSLIRLVYTKAIEWGVKIESPEKDIKRPKATMRSREERLDNVIKPNELRVILSEADRRRSNLGIYLRFLLYTGMRPTEAAHLYWHRMPIDQEKEMIKKKFPIGYVDLERGGFTKIGTKTEKRFVPGHPMALEIIEKLRKTAENTKRLVFLGDKFINNDLALNITGAACRRL